MRILVGLIMMLFASLGQAQEVRMFELKDGLNQETLQRNWSDSDEIDKLKIQGNSVRLVYKANDFKLNNSKGASYNTKVSVRMDLTFLDGNKVEINIEEFMYYVKSDKRKGHKWENIDLKRLAYHEDLVDQFYKDFCRKYL